MKLKLAWGLCYWVANKHGSAARGSLWNPMRNRNGLEKLDFGVSNISEWEQRKDIASIECLYKVAFGLSFGTN